MQPHRSELINQQNKYYSYNYADDASPPSQQTDGLATLFGFRVCVFYCSRVRAIVQVPA